MPCQQTAYYFENYAGVIASSLVLTKICILAQGQTGTYCTCTLPVKAQCNSEYKHFKMYGNEHIQDVCCPTMSSVSISQAARSGPSRSYTDKVDAKMHIQTAHANCHMSGYWRLILHTSLDGCYSHNRCKYKCLYCHITLIYSVPSLSKHTDVPQHNCLQGWAP